MALRFYSFLFAFSFCFSSPVHANNSDSFYIAIKGGISLGSYETGLNRTLLRFIQQQGESGGASLIAFSGASAGSINSVLSAIDTCIVDKGEIVDTLENNFMQRVWDIGIDDLVPTTQAKADSSPRQNDNASNQNLPPENNYGSIFSRGGFAKKKQLIKSLLAKKARNGCKVIITMSLTRLEPYRFPINEIGETIKLQRFIIPIEVREVNNSVKFKNVNMQQSPQDDAALIPTPYLKLVETAQGYVNFEDVWDVAMASSAFPLAFEPVELTYCFPHLLNGKQCTYGRAESSFYSDGGLFDNSPIGVSWDVALQKNNHDRNKLQNIKLIYINPDSYRTKEGKTLKKIVRNKKTGLWDFGVYFADSFLTAQGQEYRSALGNVLNLGARSFYMTNRYHHLLADLHFHFGAFYAKEYRLHDYLVGVYDGIHVIAQIQCDTVSGNFNKNHNRFEDVYQDCLREEVLNWIQGLNTSEHNMDTSTIDFFKYLYNTEFDKSLDIKSRHKNINILLSEAFGTVNKTKSNSIAYSDYLDGLSRVKSSLNLKAEDDLYKILYQGKTYTSEKLSGIYHNVIQMQDLASRCDNCDSRLENQRIGEALKVVEPMVNSFLTHLDTDIWPLPIYDAWSVNYGLNMSQRDQIISLEYRPEYLTFRNISTDFSLGYHYFGQEFQNDHYKSFSVGLTKHNDNVFFPTWGIGYQFETRGESIYKDEVDSIYVKGSFLNEFFTVRFLHRLGTLEDNAVSTRLTNVVELTMDLSKICQIVLPHLCR